MDAPFVEGLGFDSQQGGAAWSSWSVAGQWAVPEPSCGGGAEREHPDVEEDEGCLRGYLFDDCRARGWEEERLVGGGCFGGFRGVEG